MIATESLTLSFGSRPLFENVDVEAIVRARLWLRRGGGERGEARAGLDVFAAIREQQQHWRRVGSQETFGDAEITAGRFAGADVLHVSRHGPGHVRLSNQVTHQANISALRQAGATLQQLLDGAGNGADSDARQLRAAAIACIHLTDAISTTLRIAEKAPEHGMLPSGDGATLTCRCRS